MLVSNTVVLMKENADLFALRGVSLADINDFEALGNECEVFMSDSYFLGNIMIKSKDRDEQREAALKLAQEVSGYFLQVFGERSEEYRQLRVSKLYRPNDDIFVAVLRDIVRKASDEFAKLSAGGLTQAKIDALDAAADLMDEKLDALADAKVLRKQKTVERIEKGNALYDLLVKYATIGKLLYKEHPEIGYKQWVIYPNQKRKRKADEPPVVE